MSGTSTIISKPESAVNWADLTVNSLLVYNGPIRDSFCKSFAEQECLFNEDLNLSFNINSTPCAIDYLSNDGNSFSINNDGTVTVNKTGFYNIILNLSNIQADSPYSAPITYDMTLWINNLTTTVQYFTQHYSFGIATVLSSQFLPNATINVSVSLQAGYKFNFVLNNTSSANIDIIQPNEATISSNCLTVIQL